MPVYLVEPDGTRNNFGDDVEDENDMALIVMDMLTREGHAWVECRCDEEPEWVTRWTVLSRDDSGVPVQIASEEFDGTTKILNRDE